MNQLTIIYRRLPHQITYYKHQLVKENEELIVTRAPFKPSESLLNEVPELKDLQYQAIWYVFQGEWHDLGKIYRPSGKLEGYYCDIIRPMEQTSKGLKIDDLFLDLWIFPNGRYRVLDRDEFEEAVKIGWLDQETAQKALAELENLIGKVDQGDFPPP